MGNLQSSESHVERCYLKYIFLDVVKFSSRSAEAQSDIVHRLNSIVSAALEEHKVFSEARILIPTGDGMCIALMAEFFPYDVHVQTALTIQRLLSGYNSQEENETRKFDLRIGVNQNTDILVTDINERKNVAGAGINLAARIMNKADGGQILVSDVVHHELQPSEAYMDKFRDYGATGKHGLFFKVHQYVDSTCNFINADPPSSLVPKVTGQKKLTKLVAYYLGEAISHQTDLISIKSGPRYYSGYAAVVLLRMLAEDHYEQSNSTPFTKLVTVRTAAPGARDFEKCYQFYRDQDFWILSDAHSYVVNDRDFGLHNYSNYFVKDHYSTCYEFVNPYGEEALKQEWPEVWELYNLDDCVANRNL